MRILATSLAAVFALGAAAALHAQSPRDPAQHAHAAPAKELPAHDVPAAAAAAVAVAERFGQALVAGDLATVRSLLHEDVLILESGGAERSRDEYMGHHAISDSQFLQGTHSEVKRRRARVEGDLVWIGTESELHARRDGKPLTLSNTETMLLGNTPQGWKIVHIHWSSRPKKGA